MFTHIAGYKFVALTQLENLQANYKTLATELGLKGSIVLSPEGINLMLAGQEESLNTFLAYLRQVPNLDDLSVNRTISEQIPFKRLLVKLKPRLLPLPSKPKVSAAYLAPLTLKSWLDQNKDVVLIDVRNDYEIAYGHFKGAHHFKIDEFKAITSALDECDAKLKAKTAVFYCTGGIRCEQAAPLALKAGFKEVYQLEGGILKYFETCGASHYEGSCYVFDERVAIQPRLAQ